jgi:hypothetical protein
LGMVGARLMTSATAWADSTAAMMPSSSLNALKPASVYTSVA